MFRKTMFAMLGAGMLLCASAGTINAQTPLVVQPPPVALNPQPLPPGAVVPAYVPVVPYRPVVYPYRTRAYYPRYYAGPRVVYRSAWRGWRR